MKRFTNHKFVFIIWVVCGSAVYGYPDASTGGNGDKYVDIIPHGADPLDAFAYSLLVEHLKRPPSRISTNGEPIEHAYYIVDTHRRPDGSPIHNSHGPVPDSLHLGSSEYENSVPASPVVSYHQEGQTPQTFQTVATVRNDNVNALQHIRQNQQNDDRKDREFHPSTTVDQQSNPVSHHFTQDVQAQFNDTFGQGVLSELGNHKNDETQGKYNIHIPNSFSHRFTGSPSSFQNSVENRNQKVATASPINALSDRLKHLSQSLQRLQMLTNPVQDKPQSLAQMAVSVVQNFGGSPFLPFSHFLSTTSESPTVQVQQTDPPTIPDPIGYQQIQTSPPLTQSYPIGSTNGLEQGIPSNLNEEMAILEESLRTEKSNPTQKSTEPPSTSDQSRAHQNPLMDSQPQQTENLPLQHQQFRPHLETTVIKNGSNPSDPIHVLYHHSVSHKIPDLEMADVVNNPEIVSHSILYSQDIQPQPGSHVIFKNKYFKVQSPNSGHFGRPPPFMPHRRPQHSNRYRTHPPTSMSNVLNKAVEALNNYNDIFLHNMVSSNGQYRKYLKPDYSFTPSLQNPAQTPNAPSPLHVVDVYQQKPLPPRNPNRYPPILQRLVNKFQTLTTQTTPSSVPHPPPPRYQHPSQFEHQPKTSPTTEPPKIQPKPAYSRVVFKQGQPPLQSGRQNFQSPNLHQGNKHMGPPPSNFHTRPDPQLGFHDLHENLLGSASSNPSSISSPAAASTPNATQTHQNQTEPLKQGLKSEVVPPTLEPNSKTSSETAKYSTIFLRQQGGGSSGGRRHPPRFWHRNPEGPVRRPLNYQGFKDFGKIF